MLHQSQPLSCASAAENSAVLACSHRPFGVQQEGRCEVTGPFLFQTKMSQKDPEKFVLQSETDLERLVVND